MRLYKETARLEAELTDLPIVGDAAGRELAVADQVLAQRRELVIVAARISPPAYIKAELGERPSDPAKQKAWDRGVSQIDATVKSTASRTRTKPLGGRRNEEPSERQEAMRRRLMEMQRGFL